MKIGKLIKSNSKGQIVIPLEYRNLLSITEDVTLNIIPQAGGLFVQPIKGVVPQLDAYSSYEDILDSTSGIWEKKGVTTISDFEDYRKKEKDIIKEKSKKW